jgi:hypothetical protein
MNSTGSPNTNLVSELPGQSSGHDSRFLIEEVACAIADAQAALLAGRIQDLDGCIIRQQQLCAELKSLPETALGSGGARRELVAAAQRVRQQNLLFGAVARRMRRHLETLRHLLNGLSLTYQPKPVNVPDRES